MTDWTGLVMERQARLVSSDEYMGHLEGFYQRYLDDISYNMTSPTDDSLDAHIGNSNYYNKGAVAGSLLDLEIRHYTGGQRGMFDVLRGLKSEFGGTGKGHTLDDMERLCLKQVEGSSAGEGRIKEFFDTHLRGREAMDIQGALAHVGYKIEQQPKMVEPATLELFEGARLAVQADGDLGLVKCSHEHGHHHHHHEPAKKAFLPTLGVRLKQKGEGQWRLDGVSRDSAAGDAGLLEFRGKAIQDISFDEDSGEMYFRFEKPDMFTGETRVHEFRVKERPAMVNKMVEVDNPSPEQLALRAAWQDARLG